MEEHFEDEIEVVEATRLDINEALKALRRARDREDSELGPEGIGRRLGEIIDELLTWGNYPTPIEP